MNTDSGQKELTLIEKIVDIKRLTKVVKGGKRFSFSALVIVGDGKGNIGIELGKANEVSEAIRKGLYSAKRKMFKVQLKENTISHEVMGNFGAAKVVMKPATPGTGVIAGGAVRAVCECAGIKDVLTKSLGSNTPVNLAKAAIDGLKQLMLTEQYSQIREIKENTQDAEDIRT